MPVPDIFAPAHALFYTPAEFGKLVAGLDCVMAGCRGMSEKMARNYLQRHPDDPLMRDLEAVDRFEQEFPAAFENMMAFILRKTASPAPRTRDR